MAGTKLPAVRDIVKANTNSLVSIVSSSSGAQTGPALRVQGFIMSEFRIAVGNSYTSPLQSQAQDAIAQSVEAAKAIASNFFATDKIFSWTPRTVEQSVYTWAGSDRPKFTIGLLFIAMENGDDVRASYRNLLNAVVPSFVVEGGKATFINPPLSYLPQGGRSARGMVSVAIGKWFKGDFLLITHVDGTMSKETLPSGLPLYCQVSATFETYRIVSAQEMQQWFGG